MFKYSNIFWIYPWQLSSQHMHSKTFNLVSYTSTNKRFLVKNNGFFTSNISNIIFTLRMNIIEPREI